MEACEMDRRRRGTDRGKVEPWDKAIAAADWSKIENAAGVSFAEGTRDYVLHLLYLACEKALAPLSNAPLNQTQRDVVQAVATASDKLQRALNELKTAWLEGRLLDASDEVRKSRMEARRLCRLKQGLPAPTLLTDIAEEPTPLSREILKDVPAELSLAAEHLLKTGKLGERRRARDLDKMLLRRRLQGLAAPA